MRAERLLALPETPTEQRARRRAMRRITPGVMESIKRDVLKRLGPLDREAQRTRGLTKRSGRFDRIKLVK